MAFFILLLLLPFVVAAFLQLIMVPSAGGKTLLARQLYGRGQAITACTNASPAVITSNAHGLTNGNSVIIGGATGLTAINGGPYVVNAVTTNTFNVASISTLTLTAINGNGTFGGTCYWSLAGMENFNLKLFSNNITPAEGDTASTYTEVSNGNGYTTGGVALVSALSSSTSPVWTAPATTSGGGTGGWASSLGTGSVNVPESTCSTANPTWSWTGSVTAYGYFTVGATSTIVGWSELFSAVKNFSSGDSLYLTPRLGLTHA
jgi:hypothetical protein